VLCALALLGQAVSQSASQSAGLIICACTRDVACEQERDDKRTYGRTDICLCLCLCRCCCRRLFCPACSPPCAAQPAAAPSPPFLCLCFCLGLAAQRLFVCKSRRDNEHAPEASRRQAAGSSAHRHRAAGSDEMRAGQFRGRAQKAARSRRERRFRFKRCSLVR
jgi:hypothetical protein